MAHKTFAQLILFLVILLACFAGTGDAQAQSSCGSTYVVQPGDWLSKIANRCGVTLSQLHAANPQIWNINLIYPGQVINVPGSSWFIVGSSSTGSSADLSYGTVPAKASTRTINLINYANADVYVSFQGTTTTDKVNVIYEYSVNESRTVSVPVGQYHYVAWVGGQQFVGDFKLREGVTLSMKFYPDRVNVQ